MLRVKDIITKIFKHSSDEQPWASYYLEEQRDIKYTDKNIYEYLVECVGQDTDLFALNYFGARMTFSEMFEKIDIAAKAFRSIGVKEGDIVTICVPNTPEALISFYAINKIGAVADMIHPLSAGNEIKYYLNESKSRVLVLFDGAYAKVEDILDDTLVHKTIIVSPKDSMPKGLNVGYTITRGWKTKKPKFNDSDFMNWGSFMLKGMMYSKTYTSKMKSKDLAVILHSGGTTGKPKGIMLSNFNFNAECQQAGLVLPSIKPKEKIMTILPNFHGFGLCVSMHAPLCLRMEVILIPEFDAKRFHKTIQKYRPNCLVGVPTLWEAMLSNKRFDDVDLSDLKYMVSGGDTMTNGMEEKINNFLHTHGTSINISKGYGMTEAVAAVAFTFEGTNEPGAIGIPMVGADIKICKVDTCEELPLGEEGEICVNSPTIMMGYFNNQEETDNIIKEHEDGKKWLHTGDLGYITPDGIIYFTQRLKRMIVSSGFNVYPGQIEQVIETHPDVAKCCVVGIPHPYKMQVAKAFVVLKDDTKESSKIKKELKELCKENLAVYSVPKEFEFRDSLPKTLMNKVDFKKLEKEEQEKFDEKNKEKE